MKATVINPPATTPINPWKDVKFPCLVEHNDGSLAIATSATKGIMIHSVRETEGDLGIYLDSGYDNDVCWSRSKYWRPAIGKRTVVFEN